MSVKEIEGITKNLSSLRFDAAAHDAEYASLYLRKRSYACTINAVAHVTYFVAVLNEVKRRVTQAQNKKGVKFGFLDYAKLKIGLIGCGRLGTHVIKGLLEYADVQPEDITISTRRPESLIDDFKERGVTCCYDNVHVVENADVAFLCCAPSKTEEILKEIKGKVTCFIYSLVVGYPAAKISQLLEWDAVFKPEYGYLGGVVTKEYNWNFNYGICAALGISEFWEITCPIYIDQNQYLVFLKGKFAEILYHLALNLCLNEALVHNECLKVVNEVIFRRSHMDGIEVVDIFTESQFNEGKFRLTTLLANETKLTGYFADQNSLPSQSLRIQYKAVFDKFADWRTL